MILSYIYVRFCFSLIIHVMDCISFNTLEYIPLLYRYIKIFLFIICWYYKLYYSRQSHKVFFHAFTFLGVLLLNNILLVYLHEFLLWYLKGAHVCPDFYNGKYYCIEIKIKPMKFIV